MIDYTLSERDEQVLAAVEESARNRQWVKV